MTQIVESRTFGSIELELTRQEEIDTRKLTKISAQLNEFEEFGCLPAETEVMSILKRQKAELTYSKISLDFLQMAQEGKYTIESNPPYYDRFPIYRDSFIHRKQIPHEQTLRIPRFAVFSLDNIFMKLEYGWNGDAGVRSIGYSFRITSPANLPNIIGIQYAMGSEVLEDLTESQIDGLRLPLEGDPHYLRFNENFDQSPQAKLIWKRLEGRSYDRQYELATSFKGIIPPETKMRINEARKLMNRGVYLVAETEPKDWHVQTAPSRLIEDPLVIGVLDNTCFLIDKFDTKPLENYVAKEFSVD